MDVYCKVFFFFFKLHQITSHSQTKIVIKVTRLSWPAQEVYLVLKENVSNQVLHLKKKKSNQVPHVQLQYQDKTFPPRVYAMIYTRPTKLVQLISINK